MAHADEIATTPAELACLFAVRDLCGAADGPIERHSVRVYLLATTLADHAGLQPDRELLLCAALLHDAGLYPGAATKRAYVTDGADLARRVLAPFGWPAVRVERCFDAVERHHEPRSQWARGDEVELIRRADLIEVSQTLVRFGLARAEIKAIRKRVPVDGFVGEVAKQLLVAARRRPLSLWRIALPHGRR